jgi:hypothetical protein
VLVFTAFGKERVGFALTIGNIIGIVVGQILGDMLRNANVKTIVITMDEEQKYLLSYHYGAFIWFFVIFIIFVASILCETIRKRSMVP